MGIRRTLRRFKERILVAVPLDSIDKVTFYKRDGITTDLICCEVVTDDRLWTFHEEMPGWDALLAQVSGLPGFRRDWFAAVSQPAFAPCVTVAFVRWAGQQDPLSTPAGGRGVGITKTP